MCSMLVITVPSWLINVGAGHRERRAEPLRSLFHNVVFHAATCLQGIRVGSCSPGLKLYLTWAPIWCTSRGPRVKSGWVCCIFNRQLATVLLINVIITVWICVEFSWEALAVDSKHAGLPVSLCLVLPCPDQQIIPCWCRSVSIVTLFCHQLFFLFLNLSHNQIPGV